MNGHNPSSKKKVALAAREANSLISLLNMITTLVAEVTGEPRVCIWLLEDEGLTIRIKAGFPAGAHLTDKSFPLEERPVTKAAVESRQYQLVSNPQTNERTANIKEFLANNGITAILEVPLVTSGGDVLGVLILDHTDPNFSFKQEHIDYCCALAKFAALAISEGKLIDQLTLLNRLMAYLQATSIIFDMVRNRLQPIGGFARRLLKQIPADHPAVESANVIAEEVTTLEQSLLQLDVTDMFGPAGPKDSPLNSISISEVLREALDSLTPELESRQITCEISSDGHPDHIIASPKAIKGFFGNILIGLLTGMSAGSKFLINCLEEGRFVFVDIAYAGAVPSLNDFDDRIIGRVYAARQQAIKCPFRDCPFAIYQSLIGALGSTIVVYRDCPRLTISFLRSM